MNLPNFLTILRILLIPCFLGFMLYYKPGENEFRTVALFVFLLAVFTDALDGFLARIRHQKTKLGSFLDPIADKLLLITAYLVLTLNTGLSVRLPMWLTIVVISRDIIIIFGVVLILLIAGDIKIRPTPSGKITTFFQMVTIIATFMVLPLNFLNFIWTLTIIVTIISGIEYIYKGIGILNRQVNGKAT
ncbi:MAG: CDP-diacylglycerol--glycerol-3-phosphate 3-phosphatidyltransferase [Candidatus Omnitrophica bacterium]|nr:CDP-diacylglycerol--glycerol-3-phosphate 3-phosphatidyltransferase [Candidatus Omnitrophota bacterium]